jgi:hypothetical protein
MVDLDIISILKLIQSYICVIALTDGVGEREQVGGVLVALVASCCPPSSHHAHAHAAPSLSSPRPTTLSLVRLAPAERVSHPPPRPPCQPARLATDPAADVSHAADHASSDRAQLSTALASRRSRSASSLPLLPASPLTSEWAH